MPLEDLDWLPIVHARPPRDRPVQRFGAGFACFSVPLVHQYAKRIQTPALIEQAVEFGKQQGSEMVWAILSSPALIYMAGKVATKLDAQLVTLVWDAPEYLAAIRNFDRFSRRSLLREFGRVLRATVRCGVASEGMQSEYKDKYGVESVVLIHGIHPNQRRLPAKGPTEEGKFVIGFAGSLYAVHEWDALLSALSKIAWRIDGRNITVRLIGPNVDLRRSQGRVHIEYFGWRSVEETINLMSQVDVAYLPYWFDESYSLAVRLAFPGKLTTYLAAGRPVLFHGPEDSTPTRFFRRFPVGLCCHSLDETEIIQCLYRFATDGEFYARATAAGQEALDQELDLRVFLQRFAELIGVERAQLLPL